MEISKITFISILVSFSCFQSVLSYVQFLFGSAKDVLAVVTTLLKSVSSRFSTIWLQYDQKLSRLQRKHVAQAYLSAFSVASTPKQSSAAWPAYHRLDRHSDWVEWRMHRVTQWRWLHGTRGHVPPTLKNGWARGGTVSSRTANKKLAKLYWPSRERSTKRLIVLLEPKSGGARLKNFFRRFAPDRCPHFRSGPVPPPHFQIRSGATGVTRDLQWYSLCWHSHLRVPPFASRCSCWLLVYGPLL